MRTLGVKGLSRVDGAQQSANPLQCSVPHTDTDSAGKPALAKGIGPVTVGRSSKQCVIDYEGVLRPVYDGCAGIEGGRFVTNWLTESADFASANWAVAGGAVKNGGGSFTLPTNGAYFQHDINTSVFTPFNTGRVIRQTCKMSVLIGSGLIQLRPVGKNSPFTLYGTKNITLTSTPKVFSMLFTVTDECGGYKLRILGNDGANTQTVLIEWGQAEDVTGQSNQAPGEYVPTTSAPVTQCFNYLNPYTVDANGVVTDSGVRVIIKDQRGPELAVNGGFDTDTIWTKQAGWSINTVTGKAEAANSSSTVLYQGAVAAGKTYEIKYDLVVISGGGVKAQGGSVLGPLRSSSGTYTDRVTSDGAVLGFNSQANFTGTIDNVSCKEVLYPLADRGILLEPSTTNKCSNYNVIPGDTLGPELITGGGWVPPASWSVNSGVATGNCPAWAYLYQNVGAIGRLYQVSYRIVSITSGSVGWGAGITSPPNLRNATGTFTETFTRVNGTSMGLQAGPSGFVGVVDSITCKEIQFAVGTKATALNPTAIPGLTLSGYTQTTGNLVVGAQYKINARTTLDFTTCGAANNTVGTTFTATGGTLGAGDSVDNLSVSLSIVDDTAAHQAAGIYAVTGGKAYKLDNTLGATSLYTNIPGLSVNTNAHSHRSWIKCGDATASAYQIRLSTTSFSTSGVYATNTSWQPVGRENIVTATNDTVQYLIPAGKNLFFILNQLEEQPFSTSPVIVQGSQGARAATIESLPSAGNIKGNDFTVYLEFQTPFTVISTSPLMRLWAWYTDTNNRGGVRFDGTTIAAVSIVAASTSAASWTHTVVPNTLYKVAAVFSATGIKLFVNGALRATYTGALATNVLSSASIHFGSQGDDTGFFKGNLKASQIFRKVFSDAKCISMTQ